MRHIHDIMRSRLLLAAGVIEVPKVSLAKMREKRSSCSIL